MSDESWKVMTFNLRRRKPSDGSNTWRRRRDAVVEVVRRQAPDILGTQEGLEDQVEYIAENFPEYHVVGQGRFGGALDEHNALFYRADRFRLLDSDTFWLSDTPEVAGSRSWGNLVPRMATWARLRDKDTGREIHHVNTHLDHLVPSARRRGAQLINDHLPADDNTVAILSGDFNALQRGGTYRYLTGSKGAALLDSRYACTTPVATRWNATYHHFRGRGLYRIDYILGRGVASFDDYAVVRDQIDGQWPSDHFPVVSRVHPRAAA